MAIKKLGTYRKLAATAPGQVSWTHGFWADKFRLDQDVIIPAIWEALQVPENGAVFANLYVAAGLRTGRHLGTDWSDGDCYKWMEAVIWIYSITRDPAWDAWLDELIDVIAKTQDEDGYINTQVQLTTVGRWSATIHHELYNMGHLMTAACLHHQVTGKSQFLDVAIRLGDYLDRVFSPRPPELAHFGWDPSNIMGLVDLYRETGGERYLALADVFVTMRGSRPNPGGWAEVAATSDGTDQNQDRVLLREEDDAVGHVVTATYL